MSCLKNCIFFSRERRLESLSSSPDSFSRERRLESLSSFAEDGSDTVKLFKRELKFLDILVKLQSITNEPDMLDVTQIIQAFSEEAAVVKEYIRSIKEEIRAKYSFPKISSLPLDINVMEFVDTVVYNIRDLAVNDPETKERVEDVIKELKMLQTLVCFVLKRFIEPPNFFLAHVFAVAGHTSMVAWLYFSGGQDQTVAEIDARVFLQRKFQLVQPCVHKLYITLLQDLKSKIQSQGWYCPNFRNHHRYAADVEAGVLETTQHHFRNLPASSNSSQRVSLLDQLEILRGVVNFLRTHITCVPCACVPCAPVQDDLGPLLQDIDDVVIEVGLLVYSLYEGKEEEEEEEKEVNATQLVDLSGNIEHIISTVIRLTIRKKIQHNLPRIHGLGFVEFLLSNLEGLRPCHPASLAYIDNQLQVIQEELKSLQPFLTIISQEPYNGLNTVVEGCVTQFIDKAYEIECIVYACINNKFPVSYLGDWLLQIIEEITLIKKEVVEIHENKVDVGDVLMNSTVKAHTPSNLARSPRMNDEIVGFEEVIEKLRHQLLKGSKERVVIPIVGMPGLGKTTLAYRLYSDRFVVSHFTARAECCVSQVYSCKDLLLKILRDVATVEESCDYHKLADDELADKLRKALFSKRYLILIDDIWEGNAWDDLIGCFADNKNGSRIILTTRNHEVAEYVQSDPLQLRMFNDDESWELLRRKVFGTESCPPLLINIGQQIAKKCGKLPLTVALVSGILAEMDKKEECWEQFANNLGPHIHQDSRAIVEQSYQMLPYHLKSCFLYFGAFSEDNVIDVSKLLRLWISEGFVKSCQGKTLEDIAEGYLEDLIGRNLVMKAKVSCVGKTKACHIHDLLHDFCKERANEENHIQCIRRYQSTADKFAPVYRLSVSRTCCYGFENWSFFSPLIGSIILQENCRVDPDVVSGSFYSFKYLKVLDVESTFIGSFPTDLIYLRYFAADVGEFAARLDESSISSFLTKHRILKNHYNDRISLPISLLCVEMVKLRHLHIRNCEFTTTDYAEGLLENLQSLSTPYFSCVEDLELILGVTPNLCKLSCEIEGFVNFKEYVLNFPAHIQNLKICRVGRRATIPLCFAAPYLKKLTLEDISSYKHDYLSELQNLQVLKLNGISFAEEEWKVSNGQFAQLKVLKLERVCWLRVWHVSDDAFPNLQHLVLREMYGLEEIPCCFEDHPCLNYIEVIHCNSSLEESARHVQKTQVEDYGNHGFQVFLQNNYY